MNRKANLVESELSIVVHIGIAHVRGHFPHFPQLCLDEVEHGCCFSHLVENSLVPRVGVLD